MNWKALLSDINEIPVKKQFSDIHRKTLSDFKITIQTTTKSNELLLFYLNESRYQ